MLKYILPDFSFILLSFCLGWSSCTHISLVWIFLYLPRRFTEQTLLCLELFLEFPGRRKGESSNSLLLGREGQLRSWDSPRLRSTSSRIGCLVYTRKYFVDHFLTLYPVLLTFFFFDPVIKFTFSFSFPVIYFTQIMIILICLLQIKVRLTIQSTAVMVMTQINSHSPQVLKHFAKIVKHSYIMSNEYATVTFSLPPCRCAYCLKQNKTSL